MRNRIERFVVLPFSSIGCVSQSSVDVATGVPPQKPKSELVPTSRRREESSSGTKVKSSSWGFLPISNPKLSHGIHRLVRSLKTSIWQLFVYKEEIAEEMEMEIGYPTDVKHLTHIGWDGTTTTTSSNPVKGWENLAAPDILTFSSSSFSIKQFEIALAGQAEHGPLIVPSASK